MDCPICCREVYSGFGKNCKVCGMILKDQSKEFCSKRCRKAIKSLGMIEYDEKSKN